jgi:TonB family protein
MRLCSVFLVVLLGSVTVSQAASADAQGAQSAESQSARKVVNKVFPAYPAMARGMNLAGTVKLEAVVLANGSVKSIQVKGGNPVLVQAAQHALREWKWAKSDHDSTEMLEFRFNP